MDYEVFFSERLEALRAEGRYRAFADLERRCFFKRLLTLEDTVEVFNLILGTKPAPQEKQDLVAFLRAL